MTALLMRLRGYRLEHSALVGQYTTPSGFTSEVRVTGPAWVRRDRAGKVSRIVAARPARVKREEPLP